MTDVQYLEDLSLDDERTMGTFSLDEADIVRFAERYDPLPFHTDPERAADSLFGGLVASGFHTTVEANRVLVENFFGATSMRGALGLDELRWHAPVRPGDELTVVGRLVEKEPFNDELGLGRGRVTVDNEAGETVLSMDGLLLFGRRDAGDQGVGPG